MCNIGRRSVVDCIKAASIDDGKVSILQSEAIMQAVGCQFAPIRVFFRI